MNTDYISAKRILTGTDVSVLDAARIAKNILDAKPKNFVLTDLQFCAKVIEVGQRHVRIAEMSLAEGFGLPVIEAMTYGKPVFLSRRTSLPEIGGDKAFYFNDEFDPDGMKEKFPPITWYDQNLS